MEIRVISQEDLPAYLHIASRAFARGEPVNITPEEFAQPGRHRLGVYENGQLQAQYTIRDFQLFFGDERRPCGAIAGVACEPAARGRGYAGALIDRSLEAMRDRGQYLSLLWPFDHRFYRRYGWEWAGEVKAYTVPLRLIESDPEGDHIEPVHSDLYEILNPIYEEKARQYNGPMVRNDERWQHLLKPEGQRGTASYVYRRDGQAEGLAVIRYDEERDRARATEFVALTPRAYRGLLTLFKRHAATVDKFTWHTPTDDVLFSLLAHWDIKTRLYATAMGRLVDAQAAVRAMSSDPRLAGEAIVRLTDSHAPWNEGTWRISAEGGKVAMEASASSPGLSMDIQALTQAYWGTLSLQRLRRAGRLDVLDEGQFAFLRQLWPGARVWLPDDF